MSSRELRKRKNWQTESGANALSAEDVFSSTLQSILDKLYPNMFEVDQHPKEFNDIYSKVILPDEVLEDIYNVDIYKDKDKGELAYKWGISMDFAIRNLVNSKILFGEIKRQDGWIEGKDPSAGRGNAHERSCKYFTPGLLREIRKVSGITSEDILPFWIVFIGDITRDPKRNREISFWFQEYKNNFFMWRDTSNIKSLENFFINNLLPFLL